jgi:FHS family L-fucose permease-like MFS transporter
MTLTAAIDTGQSPAPEVQGRFTVAFVLVTSLFFLWALAHNLNDILIKHFQSALQLSRLQASFIQIAFYFAYFLFALPAGYVLKACGHQRTLVVGLVLYGLGAVAFYPAAAVGRFAPFLVALMIIAGGVVFLEIAAGAFMVLRGRAETAVFRINLAQGFNGLGAVLAPVLGGLFILSGPGVTAAGVAALTAPELSRFRVMELHQVQLPYLLIGAVAFAIAGAIAFAHFPAEPRAGKSEPVHYRKLLQTRAFAGAFLAQFCYVGAQVGTWSFFIDFARDTVPRMEDRSAAYLLSASLLLFMIGRFSGALLLRKIAAASLLFGYAAAAGLAIVLAVFTHGVVSLGCLMAVSFFMSIMYPTTFALGVAAAGKNARMAAAIMVMAIVGGAIVPPLMGWLADRHGPRDSYLVLTICFGVVGAFALYARHCSPALPAKDN